MGIIHLREHQLPPRLPSSLPDVADLGQADFGARIQCEAVNHLQATVVPR